MGGYSSDEVACLGPLPMRSFYDPEMGERAARRLQRQPRASFDFVSQGRFQKAAELQRLRARPLPLPPVLTGLPGVSLPASAPRRGLP